MILRFSYLLRGFLLANMVFPFILAQKNASVTYPVIPFSRFGDHLLSYMHAKWLSYKYDLTLLYKPFVYSEGLILDCAEKRFSDKEHFTRGLRVSGENVLQQGVVPEALYLMPYFPESPYELKTGGIKFFEVDWNDQAFVELLNKMISPKVPTKKMSLPRNVMTVAMHVRRGGSYETFNDGNRGFPVKFPRNYFYVDALNEMYTIFDEQLLYVFIFTDDQQPEKLAEYFSEIFKGKNITFDYRQAKNDHNLNVLEDFFALIQFNCLIRPDSNFSLCASKLKKYLVEVTPDDCSLVGNLPLVSSMTVKLDRGGIEFYSYKKKCESFRN